MLFFGMALKSTPAMSMSLSRRPLTSTSVLETPVAPKPRMSTVVCAPFTPPNRLRVWMPGSRARMSCKVALGERSISAEVMMVDDAPVMMVPETTPELETASEEVPSPSPGAAAGLRAGAGKRAGVLLRDGARRGPGSNRVLVTLTLGRSIASGCDCASCARTGAQLKTATHPSNNVTYRFRFRETFSMTRVLHLQRPRLEAHFGDQDRCKERMSASRQGAAASLMLWIVGGDMCHGLRIGYTCHRCEKPLRVVRPAHRLGDCAGRSPGSRVSA